MKINRLIDDYFDDTLRNYWKNNLRFLLSSPNANKVSYSTNLLNPLSPLVVHPNDYQKLSGYKPILESDLTHTINHMNQSSEEICLHINYFLNMALTDLATSFDFSDKSLLEERLSFYTPSVVAKIAEESKRSPTLLYQPTISYYQLKFPSKDLLFLSFLAYFFSYKISNKELLELTNSKLANFMEKNEIFFQHFKADN